MRLIERASMGHSHINVTLDIYGHLMPGMDEQAARKIGALLKSETA